MFLPIKFNTTIILTPNELNKTFENTILTKIKVTLENSCSKHGYIKRDSIKIIKRSPGYIKESHFNGNIAYDLNCIAEICNPAQDSVVKCIVKAKNNLGLLAIGKYEDMAILEVIIPKITSGILSDVNIDNINIDDEINVIVCGKKFTLYDKMISIVGKIIKDKDDIVQVQEIDEDNLSIGEEDNSEIDENNFDEADLFNDDDEEEDEEGGGVNYKLKKGKTTKIIGGLEFDDDIEEEEEEEEDEEEEDDELEDDLDEDDIDEDESYAETYDEFD